ncbi:uncharacterized protein LOC121853877 [Homarus americanus]|nr:uncharacterized protein LOC121853877 [Homarus americanus]
MCRRVNATLAIPTTESDNEELMQQLSLFKEVCVPTATWKMWIGITDDAEDGVWRSLDTNERLTYLKFPLINAGSSYTCASMKADGFWDGDRCTNKRCTGCYLETTDFLYLRGLCFDSKFRMRFRIQKHINDRPYFRGYYDKVIIWGATNKRWLLVDTVTNTTLMWALLTGKENYPVGKHSWKVAKEVCGKAEDTTVLLSLAPCADHLFTCNTGDCIQPYLRCNFRYDCPDGSDEVDCGVVELVDDLQRELPPPGPGGSVLILVPRLTITRIAEVDDINMAITLEFRLTLTWTDDRLRLRHLNEKKNGTILTNADAEKVWKPRYQLVNLEGGQKQLLNENLMVRSAQNATLPQFNNVDMDLVYPGETNKLSLIQRYTARVTCYFELYAYPFDIQVCSIDLELPPEHEDYVKLSIENGSATYMGPRELSKYTIEWVAFGGASGGNQLSVEFELHRRQGIVVFSNFIPSAMLLIVSWATLFVDLKALNVRAIMSLTTLLVLYTLFANMSRSLPTTASIKLIDIWFFFIIFILFINIMIHVFVDRPGPKNKIFNKRNVTVTTGVPEQESVSLKLLQRYRLLGLPMVVLFFTVYFWTAVILSK